MIGLQLQAELGQKQTGHRSREFTFSFMTNDMFFLYAMFTAGSRALLLPHHQAVNYFTFASCVTSVKASELHALLKGLSATLHYFPSETKSELMT